MSERDWAAKKAGALYAEWGDRKADRKQVLESLATALLAAGVEVENG